MTATTRWVVAVAALALASLAGAARAAEVGVDDTGSWATGTNTIGGLGLPIVDIPGAAVPNFTSLGSVDSPYGGVVAFSISGDKRTVPGGGWATWSHGATPVVYFFPGTVTLALPAGTYAFDFYAEPNPFSFFDITASANGGAAVVTQSVTGSAGAKYFGFYATGGSVLSTVTVSSTSPSGFALGEFRIANPEPSTVALFGAGVALAGAALVRRRRKASLRRGA